MKDNGRMHSPTYIFTLRLWQEELAVGESEWRLQLKSVETGRTHYFRDWPVLVDLLLTMVPEKGLDQDSELGNNRGAMP